MITRTMEGGVWGLVIIFAAFMIQFFAFGTAAAIGVYNMELLDYFENATVGVSLIGALNYGMFLGSGPIVSFLMTKFSYRQISLFGSLLTVVGIVGMPILPYIPAMCICFGLLTGFGCCCTYIPSHVLSGLYYDKYRSLATGVATSGSGLGGAFMPVIVGLLIDVYSWKGSLIFLSGICLNLFVFSSLLREPPLQIVNKEIIVPAENTEQTDVSKQAVNNSLDVNSSPNDNVLYEENCGSGRVFSSLEYTDQRNSKADKNSLEETPLVLHNGTGDVSTRQRSIFEKEPNVSPNSLKTPFLKQINSHSVSLSSLTAVGATRGSGVLVIENSILQETDEADKKLEASLPKSSRHIYIFTHSGFNIYFLSNIMWNAGFSILNSFIPEFLRERGMSPIVAAYLFGGLGFGGFIGGILGGVLGNLNCVNRQAFYTISNLLIGVTLVLFPFYDNFVFYIMCLLIVGTLFGFILGLLIIVLTDLIGVESLGNGLGYLMLSNGVGTFCGPPLAGFIKNATGLFDGGMVLAGALFLLSGVIMFVMPCRNSFRKCFLNKQ